MKDMILFNGKIVNDSIKTHTGSSFFNYGNGFFETLLYQNQKLYFWADHNERMEYAQEVFEFTLCKDWLSEKLVHDLIKINQCRNKTLRVKILCAPVREELVWDSIVFVRNYKRINREFSLFIHWEPRDGFFCNFKSVNYQALLYWRKYYKDHFNADEVAFTGFNSNVLEASSSNILVVKNKILFYVDIHENYLAGVMQKNIVRECTACGFKDAVPVKDGFALDQLKDADEILLSNSLIIAQRVGVLHAGKKEQIYEYIDHGWAERIRRYFLS